MTEPNLREEAARWADRLADGPSPGDADACAAWQGRSPAHAEAFFQASRVRRIAAATAQRPAMLALRHETLARLQVPRRPAWRRGALLVTGGALLLAGAPLAAWGIRHWPLRPAPPVFAQSVRTSIGELRRIDLPDGSRVTLDTNSRLSVRFGDGQRSASLDGQGWFELKPGDRPFTISAGGRTLSSDGGRFDVRTDPGRLRTLANSGTIVVDGAPVPAGTLLIAEGDGARLFRPRRIDALTVWRSGLVQFDDVPLADAAAELNRYRRRPIRLADPAAGALRLSGSFPTREGPAFADALVSAFPLRIARQGTDGVVIASR